MGTLVGNAISIRRMIGDRGVYWRKVVGVCLGVLALGCTQLHAAESSFPDRSVRFVLPYPPGTANDIALRMVAERLAGKWGKPVVVENRPGGSSIIGTDAVAKAAPDGYTLLANISLIVQNPSLRKNLPFDTLKDLVPVTLLNQQQLAVFVNADLQVKNTTELLSYVKDRPGQINFATWGTGSTAHLLLETIRSDLGLQMVHVPYKGGGEINKAVAAGEAHVGVADLLSPRPYIQSGKLRMIGVTGPERTPGLPDVQTLGEAGIKGFDGYNWIGIFAPAGTPESIIRKISDDIHEVQAEPALKKRFIEEMSVYPVATTPEQFKEIVLRDMKNWASVIERTGVVIE